MLGMGCSRKEDNNMWRKGKYMLTFKTNTRNKRGIISILLFIYNAPRRKRGESLWIGGGWLSSEHSDEPREP